MDCNVEFFSITLHKAGIITSAPEMEWMEISVNQLLNNTTITQPTNPT